MADCNQILTEIFYHLTEGMGLPVNTIDFKTLDDQVSTHMWTYTGDSSSAYKNVSQFATTYYEQSDTRESDPPSLTTPYKTYKYPSNNKIIP